MNAQAEIEGPFGEVLYAAELPAPISVNNLFHNVPKYPGTKNKMHGRHPSKRYLDWKKAAGQMLMAQGRRPALAGPVALCFTLGEGGCSPSIDTDNTAKAYIDLLVKQGVLPDDNRRVVRHLAITWAPGERFTVHVYRWRV